MTNWFRYAGALLLLFLSQALAAQVADVILTDGNMCTGDEVNLRNQLVQSHPPHISYCRWKDDKGQYIAPEGLDCVVKPSTTTAYTLEYTLETGGAMHTKTARLIVWENPVVVAPNDTVVCVGDDIVLHTAAVTGATELSWWADGNAYSDGAAVTVHNSHAVFTVTARNPYCATVATDTWAITAYSPINPNAGYVSYPTAYSDCKGAEVALNSLLFFYVVDYEGTPYEARPVGGTITWTSNAVPVASPEHYVLPPHAVLRADVNAVVEYESPCSGMQTYTVKGYAAFDVYGNMSTVSGHAAYQPCPGDSAYITIGLNTDCNDTIKEVTITTPHRLVASSTLYRTYQCETIPFGTPYEVRVQSISTDTTFSLLPVYDTLQMNWPNIQCMGKTYNFCPTGGCDSILSITWTTNRPDVEPPQRTDFFPNSWCHSFTTVADATYSAEVTYRRKSTGDTLVRNIDYAIHLSGTELRVLASADTSAVCKGHTTRFQIFTPCDSIVAVNFPTAQPTPVRIAHERGVWSYSAVLEKNGVIEADVTYRAPLSTADSIRKIKSAVFYVYDEQPTVTTPVWPNLCRGDSTAVTISTQWCDTIKNVTWRNKNGQPLTYLPHLHPDSLQTHDKRHYVLAPTDSITYIAYIEYMRSSETTLQSVVKEIFVGVRERPHLLKVTAAPACQGTVVNLYDYVDSSYVNLPTLLWDDNIPQPEAVQMPSVAQNVNYGVTAAYAYICSEMINPNMVTEEIIKIVVQENTKPVVTHPDPAEHYCQSYIPLLTNENDFTDYRWFLTDGTEIFPPVYTAATAAGVFDYTVVAYNTCGEARADLSTTLSAAPYVRARLDTAVCYGAQMKLYLEEYSGTISWNFETTDSEPLLENIQSAGTYIVTAHNLPCADVRDTVIVTLKPTPSVEAMDDIRVCEGSSVTLSVKDWAGDKLYWIELAGDSAPISVPNTTFTVYSSGDYIAIATNQCGADSSLVKIDMANLPLVVTSKDTVFACYGDTLLLGVERSIGTLQWYYNGVPIDPGVLISIPQTYTVTATNECGTSKPDTLKTAPRPHIQLYPEQLPSFADREYYDMLFHVENAIYPVSYALQGILPRGLTFKSNGSLSGFPYLDDYNFGEYPIIVTVRDAGDCQDTKTYQMTPAWKAPNAFMPGSRGNNNIFLSGYQVAIFDRLGALIYEGVGWTGIDNNGKNVPNGTYFYKVTISENKAYYSGYITVLSPK